MVRSFVVPKDTDLEGRTLYICAARGCFHTRRTKDFPCAKWADHIALDCEFADNDTKLTVAKAHKTKRILLEFNFESTRHGVKRPNRTTVNEDQQSRNDSHSTVRSFQSNGSKRQRLQSTIDNHADFCDLRRAKMINDALNKLLVGCALPFNIVNSVFFIDFIKAINSAYARHLPHADTFRKVYLPALFDDTTKNLSGVWKAMNNPLLTLAFDGFKGENSMHVVNITESTGEYCAFKACVDPGERREDGAFYANQMIDVIERACNETGKSPEDIYAGVVADNVSYNRTAFRILKEKYPLLFFIGCVAHGFDLLIEDLASIDEFKKLVKTARSIAEFIKSHKYALAAFKKIIGKDGQMLTLFPSTRFAFADLTVYRCLKNKGNLEQLIDSESWQDIRKSINEGLVEQFEENVTNLSSTKMSVMHEIFGSVSKIIHHLESVKARSSWVYMIVNAIMNHFNEWAGKSRTIRNLKSETIGKVKNAIISRWLGSGRKVGLMQNIHILAWIIDPYTCPSPDDLPHGWEEACKKVFDEFFELDVENINAMKELKDLLLRKGEWGYVIRTKQDEIGPKEKSFCTAVDMLIWQQKNMKSTIEDWELTGIKQFPVLGRLAKRLVCLSVQSANVERVCKSHKVIHSKIRNRLHVHTVHMLLYCFVNLRLIRRCNDELGDFLLQCLAECEVRDDVDCRGDVDDQNEVI